VCGAAQKKIDSNNRINAVIKITFFAVKMLPLWQLFRGTGGVTKQGSGGWEEDIG